MYKFFLICLFLVILPILCYAQSQVTTDSSYFPDIEIHSIEIVGSGRNLFNTLRRQPILGYNPPSHIFKYLFNHRIYVPKPSISPLIDLDSLLALPVLNLIKYPKKPRKTIFSFMGSYGKYNHIESDIQFQFFLNNALSIRFQNQLYTHDNFIENKPSSRRKTNTYFQIFGKYFLFQTQYKEGFQYLWQNLNDDLDIRRNVVLSESNVAFFNNTNDFLWRIGVSADYNQIKFDLGTTFDDVYTQSFNVDIKGVWQLKNGLSIGGKTFFELGKVNSKNRDHQLWNTIKSYLIFKGDYSFIDWNVNLGGTFFETLSTAKRSLYADVNTSLKLTNQFFLVFQGWHGRYFNNPKIYYQNPFTALYNTYSQTQLMYVKGALQYAIYPSIHINIDAQYRDYDNIPYYTAHANTINYAIDYTNVRLWRTTAYLKFTLNRDIWFEVEGMYRHIISSSVTPLPYFEKWSIKSGLNLALWNNLILSYQAQFLFDRYMPTNEHLIVQKLSPYLSLDATISLKLNTGLYIFTKMYNIFDQTMSLYTVSYTELPITIQGGIEINL